MDLPEKRRGGDGEAEDLGEGLGGLAGPPQIRGVEAVKAYAAAAEALGEAEGLPDTHGGEGDVQVPLEAPLGVPLRLPVADVPDLLHTRRTPSPGTTRPTRKPSTSFRASSAASWGRTRTMPKPMLNTRYISSSGMPPRRWR